MSPEPEDMQWPPMLVWDEFGYAGGAGRVSRIANPLKGRPPVAVTVPAPPGLGADPAYDTTWLHSFIFDRKAVPMSIRYRSPDGADAADHLKGVASGIAEIVRRGPALGYDASRMVLVGKGWAAAVAALLATDPSWLEEAGVPFASVRGVLILGGAGLDPSRPPRSEAWAKAAAESFGDGEARRRFSPLAQVGPPDAPAFLLFAPPGDRAGVAEAQAFAAALVAAGARAEVRTPVRSRPYIWSSHVGHPTHAEYGSMKRFFDAALPRRR